jgi:hypothetical protein
MFKMGSHDPFGHLKHKLWPKKGPKVNMTIWSPRFPCVQVMCDIPLESSQWGLQRCLRFHLHPRSINKVVGPKVAGFPTLGISGLPLGSSETKWYLDVELMAMHRVYYKGEGGGFPQVWAVVSLVSPSLPVVRPSTKSAQITH